MTKEIPERFQWAAGIMQIRSGQTILEVGCGAGLLAELVAKALVRGKLIALDTSESMLKHARQRNEAFIRQGVLELIHDNFNDVLLLENSFDSIVAFNVGFFWKGERHALRKTHQLLKSHGTLYVFHQAPVEMTLKSAGPLKETLNDSGFQVEDVIRKKLLPTSALGVIARKV